MSEKYISDWITKSYLEKLFFNPKSSLNKYQNIIDFKIEPACLEGSNFSSVLLRVTVKLCNNKSVSLIVKTIIREEVASDVLINQFNVHEKEIFVYAVILPEYAKIFNTNNPFTPFVYDIDHVNSAIIFEDLSKKGFVVADRVKCLDEQHCEKVLEKLAKLHAGSMILNYKNPDIFKNCSIGMVNRNVKLLHDYLNVCLKIARDEMKSWHNCQKFISKMQILEDSLVEKACCVFDFNTEKDTFTFLHGDLWTSNILFKYDDDKILNDAMLIDFQMSSFGSPVIDLIYFFFTSAKDHIIMDKLDKMLEFYHENLSKNLEEFQFSHIIPSLDKLKIEWTNKYFHAFISAFMFRPFMIYEGKADISTIMGTHDEALEFKKKLFSYKPTKNLLQKLLPIFEDNGIFKNV
uniref:CSON006815 protein n=1 Tax=Culicoides sonorensis TaxID=179676 RepID=A0A336LXE6_CULSO